MPHNERLFDSLHKLCTLALQHATNYKFFGKLIKKEYQRIPVKNIDYELESFTYDWENAEAFYFYKWNPPDVIALLDNLLAKSVEYDTASQLMLTEFRELDFLAVYTGLRKLLLRVLKDVPNGHITPDNIGAFVQNYLESYENYFNKIPVNWNIELWLSNIHIESEELLLSKDVFLRRPSKEQLTLVRSRPRNFDEEEIIFDKALMCGAILSFNIAAGDKPVLGNYPEMMDKEIEQWSSIFRLFKTSMVKILFLSATPNSIFQDKRIESFDDSLDSYIGSKQTFRKSDAKLIIKKPDEDKFLLFIKRTKSALSSFSNDSYLKGDYMDLSLHRYFDALIKPEVTAYRILSSVTSLEALFGDDATAISYKVRLRVAKLLSFFEFDPIDVAEKVKNAYNLRSKLVHGAKPVEKKKNLLDFADKYLFEFFNYNRICILSLLQLKNLKSKEDIIKLIDNSFIDEKSNKELGELISNNVEIPVVFPYRRKSDSEDM